MKNCSNCGGVNPLEANHCAYCGTAFSVEINQTENAEQAVNSQYTNNQQIYANQFINENKNINNQSMNINQSNLNISSENSNNKKNNKNKKYAIIGCVVAVIVLVGALLIFDNFGNSDKKQSDKKNDIVSQTSSINSTATTTTAEAKKENTDGYYFWKDTIKKGETKQITKLFNDRFKMPVTLDTFTSYGKFRVQGTFFLNGVKHESNDWIDFKTLSSYPMKFFDGDCMKWESEKLWDNEFDDGVQFEFFNPNKKECYTIKNGFDDGFFKAYLVNGTGEVRIGKLGITGVNGLKIWNNETKKYEVFDKLIESYGTPSYILASENFKSKSVEKGDIEVSYSLIYEYDSYVIEIDIDETVYISPNKWVMSKIRDVIYYPRKGWDNYFKKNLADYWKYEEYFL
ncbi:MAG: zinc ribbon domain-containing protein [Bacilli bacterium]|nr:zinc ribbon domain-containing protein [Bacilli bacterium]